MKTTELDYHLPERLIAQHSVTPRDSSKLLVFNRATQSIEHRVFRDIVDYLQPGDLLVFNNSKVFRARLRDISGVIEIFLLRPRGNFSWECLGKPGKKLQVGDEVVFEKGVVGIVEERFENGRFLLKFSLTPAEVIAFANEVEKFRFRHTLRKNRLSLRIIKRYTQNIPALLLRQQRAFILPSDYLLN